jgi:branched-chain amino acid transport system ATP-binding protein
VRLEVFDLVSGYGDVPVLNGVSLSAEPGKVTSVFGPNGAGKSTLLKTIFGVLRPKSGRVLLDGEEVTGSTPEEMLRRGVSYIPQERSIFPDLTVEENLRLTAWIVRRDRTAVSRGLQRVYELFPALKENRDRKAVLLSGGQQRMLEIARFLVLNSRVILLDEPSAGLSPLVYSEVLDVVARLKEAGLTVLLVDQNIRSALRITDQVYILEGGRVTFSGTRSEFHGKMAEIVATWLKF